MNFLLCDIGKIIKLPDKNRSIFSSTCKDFTVYVKTLCLKRVAKLIFQGILRSSRLGIKLATKILWDFVLLQKKIISSCENRFFSVKRNQMFLVHINLPAKLYTVIIIQIKNHSLCLGTLNGGFHSNQNRVCCYS